MEDKFDVSIIIVNYNTEKLVEDCIRSIREQVVGCSYEIIIVDNSSSESSVNKLRKLQGENLSLILNEQNLGFGKANNRGVEAASGQFILLLNPDTILLNDAASEMVRYLKSNKCIGAVGGNLYLPDNRPNHSYSNTFDSYQAEISKSNWSSILKTTIERILNRSSKRKEVTKISSFNFSNSPIQVAYIFGADLMLSRSLFNQVGGFDPDFFMYGEEQELQYRIQKEGFQIWNVPTSKIIHLDGASFKYSINDFNPSQYQMRLTGRSVLFDKISAAGNGKLYLNNKKLELERTLKLAKLFRRKQLTELTSLQLKALSELEDI